MFRWLKQPYHWLTKWSTTLFRCIERVTASNRKGQWPLGLLNCKVKRWPKQSLKGKSRKLQKKKRCSEVYVSLQKLYTWRARKNGRAREPAMVVHLPHLSPYWRHFNLLSGVAVTTNKCFLLFNDDLYLFSLTGDQEGSKIKEAKRLRRAYKNKPL